MRALSTICPAATLLSALVTCVNMEDHRIHVRSPEKIDFNDGNNFEDASSRRRTSRSDHVDTYDAIIYDSETLDYQYPFHGGLDSLLTRLFEVLRNESAPDDHDVLKRSNSIGNDDEDRCQKWLDNREKLERAFPGSIVELPACPCRYPNNIFYDNLIWDRKRGTNFRWRDASSDPQRLEIYKRGAAYCVRSLPAHGSESAAAQHCCYDEKRRLLTRGSGAGTPYLVSPDMSPVLHDKLDLLPWRLCKGDFTRYNKVRIPNNDNNCETNPDDGKYQRQVEDAKNYLNTVCIRCTTQRAAFFVDRCPYCSPQDHNLFIKFMHQATTTCPTFIPNLNLNLIFCNPCLFPSVLLVYTRACARHIATSDSSQAKLCCKVQEV